jgi:hypothetical protein
MAEMNTTTEWQEMPWQISRDSRGEIVQFTAENGWFYFVYAVPEVALAYMWHGIKFEKEGVTQHSHSFTGKLLKAKMIRDLLYLNRTHGGRTYLSINNFSSPEENINVGSIFFVDPRVRQRRPVDHCLIQPMSSMLSVYNKEEGSISTFNYSGECLVNDSQETTESMWEILQQMKSAASFKSSAHVQALQKKLTNPIQERLMKLSLQYNLSSIPDPTVIEYEQCKECCSGMLHALHRRDAESTRVWIQRLGSYEPDFWRLMRRSFQLEENVSDEVLQRAFCVFDDPQGVPLPHKIRMVNSFIPTLTLAPLYTTKNVHS